MENLYGQGSEGAPPNAEDCDAGESEPHTLGGHLLEWWMEGQRTGTEGVLEGGARAERPLCRLPAARGGGHAAAAL